MRDGILLAEDPPASLIQTHCLSVSAMTVIILYRYGINLWMWPCSMCSVMS